MRPGRALEQLLTMKRPEGQRRFYQEATQIRVPIFPANTTLSFSAAPIASDYAQIIFGVKFGSSMVPDAFQGFVQLWGRKQITGVFSAAVLAIELEGLVWTTASEPALIYLTNVSGLNQFFEINFMYVRVASEEDYQTALDAFRHMATSSKSEELAGQANALLSQIAGGA